MFSPESGSAVYGPAVNLEMVETKSPEPTPSAHFVEATKKGHAIYIQQPEGLPSACLGGLSS
jgi:hypothetical protein